MEASVSEAATHPGIPIHPAVGSLQLLEALLARWRSGAPAVQGQGLTGVRHPPTPAVAPLLRRGSPRGGLPDVPVRRLWVVPVGQNLPPLPPVVTAIECWGMRGVVLLRGSSVSPATGTLPLPPCLVVAVLLGGGAVVPAKLFLSVNPPVMVAPLILVGVSGNMLPGWGHVVPANLPLAVPPAAVPLILLRGLRRWLLLCVYRLAPPIQGLSNHPAVAHLHYTWISFLRAMALNAGLQGSSSARSKRRSSIRCILGPGDARCGLGSP